MSKDWTTVAAEGVMQFLATAAGLVNPREEIGQYVAGIIRTAHETEGLENCRPRYSVKEQDPVDPNLLAQLAASVAPGIVSLLSLVDVDVKEEDQIRREIALESVLIARQILACIEESKPSHG